MKKLLLIPFIAFSCSEDVKCVVCTQNLQFIEIENNVTVIENVCLEESEIEKRENDGTYQRTVNNNGVLYSSVSKTVCK